MDEHQDDQFWSTFAFLVEHPLGREPKYQAGSQSKWKLGYLDFVRNEI